MRGFWSVAAVAWALLVGFGTTRAAEPHEAADLNPVKNLPPQQHAPVELTRGGRPIAVVHVADPKPSATLDLLVRELVEAVRLTSTAELSVTVDPPAAGQPAIVIGDCPEARAAGIDAAGIPVEGFVVKTGPHRVFLVGSTAPLPARHDPYDAWANEGTA